MGSVIMIRVSSRLGYRPEIDGLRALAVVPVVLFHAGFDGFAGGFIGVDVFFVISGYLIASILLADLDAGNFSIAHFYERRARRILPALFFVMLCALPAGWWLLEPSLMYQFGQSLISSSLFFSNILFWLDATNYFRSESELKPLLHTWSLAVEEQYYLLFPVFLWGMYRWARPWLVPCLVLVALLSLALGHWGSIYAHSASFYLLPTRGWELLLGVLAACYKSRAHAYMPPRIYREVLAIVGMLALLFTVCFGVLGPVPGLPTLIPTLGTILLVLCADPQTVVGKILSWKPVVGLGLISYSLYLWHHPLFAFGRLSPWWPEGDTRLAYATLITASLTLAYTSWRYIEQPFRDRARFSRRQIFAWSALAMLLFTTVGATIVAADGVAARFAHPGASLIRPKYQHIHYQEAEERIQPLRRPFGDDATKKKLLIVGDSLARDLANAFYESRYAASYDLSMHYIDAACGNLWLNNYKWLQQSMSSVQWRRCLRRGHYGSPEVRALVSEADEIWLASMWKSRYVDHIPESLRNIAAHSHGKIRVFGRKKRVLPGAAVRPYLDKTPMERSAVVGSRASIADIERINRRVEMQSMGHTFVDMHDFYCGDQTCRPFTPAGELIFFDSVHLTKEGAIYTGEKLATLMDTWRLAD